MRPFLNAALASTALLSLPVAAHPTPAECEPIKAEEFSRFVSDKKPEEIVFFASWCGGCVSHLKTASVEKSVLVVAFDEKKSAEKAMRSIFKKGGPKCFFDADGSIVKAYGVVGLPYTKKLIPSGS